MVQHMNYLYNYFKVSLFLFFHFENEQDCLKIVIAFLSKGILYSQHCKDAKINNFISNSIWFHELKSRRITENTYSSNIQHTP